MPTEHNGANCLLTAKLGLFLKIFKTVEKCSFILHT